ncbi:MAG: ECF transporter S component, partial [Clostridia bacterium]|nr:ECF transporter S component [Clostridia bacterium]
GELGDLIIGMAFAVIPALIYKRKKTMKFALIGLIAGTVASIAAAILSNIFLLIPFYTIVRYEGDFGAVVNIISAFAPGINENNFYGLYSLYVVIPFNLLRCTIAAVVTFPLFKRIAALLDKIITKK